MQVKGAAYTGNQAVGEVVDEDITLSPGVSFVNVTGNSPTITLQPQPRIADRVRVACNGGSATVSGGTFSIIGGTSVSDGSEATFEFVEGDAWIATNSGGGGIGVGEILVANLTALTALDSASLPNGIKGFPATIKQPYIPRQDFNGDR